MHIKLGLYRHVKGNLYQVIGLAYHEKTHEPLVIYQCLYGSYGLWARPYDQFIEMVEYDGKKQPRFAFVGEHLSVPPTLR